MMRAVHNKRLTSLSSLRDPRIEVDTPVFQYRRYICNRIVSEGK